MQPQQPVYSPQPNNNPYDFIVNPASAPRRSLIPGGNSAIGRLVVVIVAIFILLIIFVVGKNLLTAGSSNTSELVSTAGQQQELIHLATNASLQTTLNQITLDASTQNFALTTKLSLTSQQQELLAYMKTQGKKVTSKQLAAHVSTATDQQLSAALAASTYDATFRQIMTTKLTTYKQTLQQTYGKTEGPIGRALLKKDYDTAQLLLQQLNPTAN